MTDRFWVSWNIPFSREETFEEPKEPLTFGEIIYICKKEGIDATFTGVEGNKNGYATADGDYELIESES